jgi:hypothetical protein
MYPTLTEPNTRISAAVLLLPALQEFQKPLEPVLQVAFGHLRGVRLGVQAEVVVFGME